MKWFHSPTLPLIEMDPPRPYKGVRTNARKDSLTLCKIPFACKALHFNESANNKTVFFIFLIFAIISSIQEI